MTIELAYGICTFVIAMAAFAMAFIVRKNIEELRMIENCMGRVLRELDTLRGDVAYLDDDLQTHTECLKNLSNLVSENSQQYDACQEEITQIKKGLDSTAAALDLLRRDIECCSKRHEELVEQVCETKKGFDFGENEADLEWSSDDKNDAK